MAELIIQGEAEKRAGVHYAIDSAAEPIGIGGMGKVFEGVRVDERTGVRRPVAIKFIYDHLQPENGQIIERARREASIRLRNDNLVEMLGFVETVEMTEYGEVRKHYHVVSELLMGVSLSDVLEGRTTDQRGNEVPYAQRMLEKYRNAPEVFAREVVSGILSGLAALHDAGYVHRDIDPTNIMLTEDGHVKLIDFGIAKKMSALSAGDRSLTLAGKFMGKAKYAAPELVVGDIQHQNQTTDIYAMGILLYELICKKVPFDGAAHEVLDMQLNKKMPVHNVKNAALRKIIQRATEKKQSLRYQSAYEFRVDLDRASSAPAGGGSNVWNIVIPIVLAVAGLGCGVLLNALLK